MAVGYFTPAAPISGFTVPTGRAAPRPGRNAGRPGYLPIRGPVAGFTVPTGRAAPRPGYMQIQQPVAGFTAPTGGRPAPPPPPNPGDGASAAGPPPAPPPPSSPYDSTYNANVAGNQFKVNNQVNALNLQGSQNDTALAQALAQLNYQQPRDSLKLEQGFNNRGGLYSSVYGQSLGDLTHSYATRQTAAQTQHDQRARSLAGQISALQEGVPIYNNEQAAAAVGRASAAALNDPTLGQNAFASADAPFLAPGAAAPNYALRPPPGAPANARWAGSASPGRGWKGIGGGWWRPGK